MPTFVMKADRDRDLYVGWSTVVDNVCWMGDRAEALRQLAFDVPPGYDPQPGKSPEDRLRRADESGTSALFYSPPFQGSWEDSALMVEQRGMLSRADLGRYLDALAQGDEAAAYALVRPFEDD